MINLFYNIFIYPLVVIYEIFYNISIYLLNNVFVNEYKYVFSILIVSIIVNILTYPLYKKADLLQKETRETKRKMSKWVNHIKKSFKGDEQYFMLSAYYREQNYKPIYDLKESISLFLQIPFFAAAYIFFTKYVNLDGVYLFSNINLGKEDALLSIFDTSINILPIIMTVINIVGSVIYTKGLSVKDKIKPIILAIIFLVVLYKSPSALVLYWTFNNIISLIKIIYFKNKTSNIEIKKENSILNNKEVMYLLLSAAIFVGVVIPSLIIKSSPDEFETIYYTSYSFIINTFFVFIGFSFWIYIFYIFVDNKDRFIRIIFSINIFMIINHLFYLNGLRNVSTLLKLNVSVNYSIVEIVVNIIVFVAIIVITKLFFTKFNIIKIITKAMLITFVLWGIINIFSIYRGLNNVDYEMATVLDDSEKIPRKNFFLGKKAYIKEEIKRNKNSREEDGSREIVNISKKGKNVIMICLDRFVARYYPYIIEVVPSLKETLEGFTVYENTLSFGQNTISAAPAMYGGYEYIPYESNKVNKELVDKYNESITIIPKKLSDEGYNVTVAEIPYENYYDVKKESVWKNIDNVKNIYLNDTIKSKTLEKNIHKTYDTMKRNFIYYSIMKVSPLFMKDIIYDAGNYMYKTNGKNNTGYGTLFLQQYAILENLKSLCKVVDDDSNNAFILHNLTSHEPNNLSFPDFYPDSDDENKRKNNDYVKNLYNKKGEKFEGSEEYLDVAIAALIKVADFLEYLKENNAYDNTRIVIVADHGGVHYDYTWEQAAQLINVNPLNGSLSILSPQTYNPLFMYKDFNSSEYVESDEFMTNADTPYLILNGLTKDMINPYTNNEISMDYKNDNDVFYIISSVRPQTGFYLGRKQFHSEDGRWDILKGKEVMKSGAWDMVWEGVRE